MLVANPPILASDRDVLKEYKDGEKRLGTSWFYPILPSRYRIWEWRLPDYFDETDLNSDAKIIWDISADNAPRQTGSIYIRDIEFEKEVAELRSIVMVITASRAFSLFLILLVILGVLWWFLGR